jgi:hypothetical protein
MARRGHRALAALLSMVAIAGCGPTTAGGAASPSGGGPLPTGYVQATAAYEFVASGPDDLATPVTPNQGSLIGPHFALQLDTIGHATSLTERQAHVWGLPGAVRAASGYELLLAHTTNAKRGTGIPNDTGKGTTVTQAEVRVGGRTEKLPKLGPQWTVVVSVPAGGDATLAVPDSDRTQTMSLRTATRGADAVGAYYAATSASYRTDAHGKVTEPGLVLISNDLTFHSELSVRLAPYTDEHGWTPAGHAQLTVEADLSIDVSQVDASLDAAQSFSVKLPDGRTVPAAGGRVTIHALGTSSNSAVLTFDVPDTTNKGTLTFSPTGTLTVRESDGKDHSVRWSRGATGSAAFDLSW